MRFLSLHLLTHYSDKVGNLLLKTLSTSAIERRRKESQIDHEFLFRVACSCSVTRWKVYRMLMGETQLYFLKLDAISYNTSLSGNIGVLVHEWHNCHSVAILFLIGFHSFYIKEDCIPMNVS